MCKLSDIEKNIIKKGHGVGNQVLYQLCEDYPLIELVENGPSEKQLDGLAAQMWLIGRAYAASPERRGYGVLKNKKVDYSVSGNGLDDYFDKLAERLTKELKSDFLNLLKKLKEAKYTFDNSENDTNTLKNSITAVIRFNRLLKDIRFEVDKKDLINHIKKYESDYEKEYKSKNAEEILTKFKDNSKNLISFCSKFLHFHFPSTIFIIDSITESHFKGKNEKIFNFGENEDNNTSKIMISNKEVYSFINNSEIKDVIDKLDFSTKNKSDDPQMKYIKHCVREFLLATKINDSIKNDKNTKFGTYIPRVIDTYMLIANSL